MLKDGMLQGELFKPLTRDERQAQAIKFWKETKGRATIVGCTGFGKTRVAIKIIAGLKKSKADLHTIVLVPTTTLKEQWKQELDEWGLGFNTEIYVMMGASKKHYDCDLLVIDK